MTAERRNLKRRKCNYYLKLVDYSTQQLVGYFSDLSTTGFKIDTPQPIAVNKDYNLRVDLADDVSDKAFIAFVARSRWLTPDSSDPGLMNAGFQIVGISAQDNEIFQRVVEKYGIDSAW
jgi:hypothetical protein